MASMSENDQYPAFTNFTIKVDVKGSWPRTVTKLLKSVQGVTSFTMEDDGKINISGYIEPTQLLKCLGKAGKSARMVHWQYGECSSKLFEKKPDPPSNDKPDPPSDNNGNGYYLYPGYGYGYGDYYGYGYNYSWQRNGRDYAYNHLECANCHGHHTEKPKTPEKSSPSLLQKPTDTGTIKTSDCNGATCCSLM